MDNYVALNANPLVRFLSKTPDQFTKEDLLRYIAENGIRMINFRYMGADRRLKTLNFPVTNRDYVNSIFTYGERVDGSSLFPYIEAGSSDLYVIPRFRTAYRDPFAEIPTLGMLCSFYTKDGTPLESAPEYTLKKAHRAFSEITHGLRFEAMGELEFYVCAPAVVLFPNEDQHGYHESAPFAKFEAFRCEAIDIVASLGGILKYGHCEVGNFTLNGVYYEQNELEFLPCPVEEAADQLVLAEWALRALAFRHGLDLTFSPKITAGKAGSGLHFHTRITDEHGQSVMIEEGRLSDIARTAIAGYMQCAAALTAFGNTNPISYFRLVPHQEAPTSICWGDRNRSVLVRVPLGWTGDIDMCSRENPLEKATTHSGAYKQTVEIRSGDGSADIYQMLAGILVAAREGFENPNALEVAAATYVDVNIHDEANHERLMKLAQLPASCEESSEALEAQRHTFEKYGVFSPLLINGIISKLRGYHDRNLRAEVASNNEKTLALVKEYFYC